MVTFALILAIVASLVIFFKSLSESLEQSKPVPAVLQFLWAGCYGYALYVLVRLIIYVNKDGIELW